MKVVLLSGGEGTRLWPLSTDKYPKQYLKIFKNNFSMLEKTYSNLLKIFSYKNIYVATQNKYLDIIKKQININNDCIIEPQMIGTFGAILNIAAYFKYNDFPDNEVIAILPTDHDVDYNFYKKILEAENVMEKNNSDICLIGIKPSSPSNQYGYIIYENNIVKEFHEKPKELEALSLIEKKALWNSGIVIARLGYLIKISKNYFNHNSYKEFIGKYLSLPKNSFDKEILEKISNISIIESENEWNDLGTWETLSNKISKPDNYNTNILNFDDKIIKNEGVSDSIVVNTDNGILLTKKKTNNIVWRNWGYYVVLNSFDENNNKIKIKKIKLNMGKNISYQYHNYRSETWFIQKGNGILIIDDEIEKVCEGDIIFIKKGQFHSIKCEDDMEFIEIQSGLKTEESDIVRVEYDWNKIIKNITKKN